MRTSMLPLRALLPRVILTSAMTLPALSGCAAQHGSESAAAGGAGGAGGSGISIGSSGNGGNGGENPGLSTGITTAGSGLGCKTTVSGVVHDPSGKLPLYNVVVYVPGEALSPIAEGASCETCDGNFSGKPIAAALSDAAGKFTMDVSVLSSTKDVPVVVQVGKWRREIKIPSIAACGDTVLDAGLTRLPKNKGEGNLPKIAMVRGGSDALECLIRKLGVDDAEFTTDSQNGRVHLYYIAGGTATSGTSQMAAGGALATSSALFSDLAKMKTYDLIMMACPGSGSVIGKSPLAEHLNVRAYADQGGRVFGSHYNLDHIRWDKYTPMNPYPDVVQFTSSAHGFADDYVATGIIDTSFPKGKAMSEWLVNVGGSTVPGQFPILDGEHSVDSVINPNGQSWITTTDDKGHAGVVEYFSFPTPIDGAACGRMVFSSLHVSSGTGDSGKVAFPNGCTSATLSPQEKALAFMFFDLASCVQPETGDPTPPPIPK